MDVKNISSEQIELFGVKLEASETKSLFSFPVSVNSLSDNSDLLYFFNNGTVEVYLNSVKITSAHDVFLNISKLSNGIDP